MIIQDTNLLSELVRPAPNPHLLAWYARFSNDDLAITAISAAELLYGLELMPHGRRRQQLARYIAMQLSPFADRILPFSADATPHYAAIVATRRKQGRPIGVQDAMIAAIARSHGMTLATRNVKDFAGTGVDLVNPWEADL